MHCPVLTQNSILGHLFFTVFNHFVHLHVKVYVNRSDIMPGSSHALLSQLDLILPVSQKGFSTAIALAIGVLNWGASSYYITWSFHRCYFCVINWLAAKGQGGERDCGGPGAKWVTPFLKHAYIGLFYHNYYCVKLCCDMGQVYEIKLAKALTCGWYFFAVIKVITYKGYS